MGRVSVARARLAAIHNHSLLTSDSTVARPLQGQAFADRMSWRILKPVTKDSRRSENSWALAADEGWRYEGLGDTGGQFKNRLIPEHLWRAAKRTVPSVT